MDEDDEQADSLGATDQGLWMPQREFASGAIAWMTRAADRIAQELHPLYGMIKREPVSDLPRPFEEAEEQSRRDLASPLFRPMKIEHEWLVHLDEALRFDTDSFLARLFEMADSFGGQLTAGMLEHISEVTEQAGQTVDAQGRELFDAFLETADKVEWSFDEEGKPQMVIVVPPEVAAKLREKPPTREQQERMRMLVERKREEWRASRRRRDLP